MYKYYDEMSLPGVQIVEKLPYSYVRLACYSGSMERITRGLRKVIVAAIGLPLFAVGLILIPLPGPGLLTCFLALFILSLEFDWASRRFQTVKKQVVTLINETKEKQRKILEDDTPKKK